MSEVEDSKEQEEATEKPSSEPEPVLSATSAPREDQVQNAVTFLSHPKVTINLSAVLQLAPNSTFRADGNSAS